MISDFTRNKNGIFHFWIHLNWIVPHRTLTSLLKIWMYHRKISLGMKNWVLLYVLQSYSLYSWSNLPELKSYTYFTWSKKGTYHFWIHLCWIVPHGILISILKIWMHHRKISWRITCKYGNMQFSWNSYPQTPYLKCVQQC